MNTIGDLYCRIEDREQALFWYQKLADTFEYREMPSNAIQPTERSSNCLLRTRKS